MFAEKPDIYRSNLSCRDRLGFYAEIQIILGQFTSYCLLN